MSEPVIQIENLTKTFRSRWRRPPVRAVNNLAMSVAPGSVMALVGPNGAGKTTTIYMLLGLLKPDHGSIGIFGRPAGDRVVRQRVGFQSEIFYSYPFQTARGALEFYGRLSSVPHDKLTSAIPRRLEQLGLGTAMDRKVGTFSKGMVQRLGLAQALLHEPELLILDEPTTGLDPEGRKLVADIILEERARGTAVLLSSHILSDVERTCDHVVMIRNGEAVLSEQIATLNNNSDEWEVEVLGWTPAVAASLAQAGFGGGEAKGDVPPVIADRGGAVRVVCLSARKKELLRLLLDLPVEIGAMRRRAKSLEDLYMQYVGGSSSG